MPKLLLRQRCRQLLEVDVLCAIAGRRLAGGGGQWTWELRLAAVDVCVDEQVAACHDHTVVVEEAEQHTGRQNPVESLNFEQPGEMDTEGSKVN